MPLWPAFSSSFCFRVCLKALASTIGLNSCRSFITTLSEWILVRTQCYTSYFLITHLKKNLGLPTTTSIRIIWEKSKYFRRQKGFSMKLSLVLSNIPRHISLTHLHKPRQFLNSEKTVFVPYFFFLR